VPILACAAGGIPEVVRDGINGRLVAPGDVAGLTAALTGLLGDADLRRRMGRDGRALAEHEFSIAAMAAGNLAVYRELIRPTGR
jgi:glycosyltransferase involved in cell wall biosynthesis